MINSLIIGFGNRAKQTVIPALQVINEGKIFVFSKNFEKLNNQKKKYGVEPVKTLNNVILKDINKIFLCVPSKEFLFIIKNLSKHNPVWINLFIDTPIVPIVSNLKIKNYQDHFKNIFVSEDYFFNPINEIIKKIIDKNNLGKIKKIEYINMGHLYHSLAQSRDLLNKHFINSGKKTLKNFKFNLMNSKIHIIGDRTDNGYTNIYTKNDLISINKFEDSNKYKINYLFNDKVLSGYSFNNKELNLNDILINDFINLKNVCKTHSIDSRGLQEQIISLVNLIRNTEIENGKKYFLEDGIYDSFVIAVTNKIKFYFDIKLNNKSLLFIIFYKLFLLRNIFKRINTEQNL